MKKVVVIQSVILHYRRSFYRELGQQKDIDLTVIHSGKSENDQGFREISLRKASFGGLHWQIGLGRHLADADLVIAMFDPRWLSTVAHFLLNPGMRGDYVLWGIGAGKSKLVGLLRVWMARRSGAILTYSPSGKEFFEQHGIPKEKMIIAWNTLQVPNASRGVIQAEDAARFLFVGTLNRRKGILPVLEEFQQLSKRYPVSLDIVGDGGDYDLIKSKIGELGLQDSVFLHGRIQDPQLLREYFHRALAVISPFQAGLTVLQSFAYGCPVITRHDAISGGEIENIEDEVTGLLIGKAYPSFEAAMEKLVVDRKFAERLGANAFCLYMEGRTIGHMVERFREAIGLVSGKGNQADFPSSPGEAQSH